ncbi:MAG: L-2-hydroxyglutarate oxidase [Limisphaerales bacterium]
MEKQVIVIGGGIVGLATALKLSQQCPHARIRVLEKEPAVARHQTGNNSGVLHCGLYYKPGSIKARLAVSGIQEMVRFCAEHKVAHEVCGKIVVAIDESEVSRLRSLHQRGKENGLKGLKWLSREEMREIEPHVAGVAALRVPQEGIVDFPGASETMARLLEENGHAVTCNSEVIQLNERGGNWLVTTRANEYVADFVVNCTGLHCDLMAKLAGERPRTKVVPFRGEYFEIRPERQDLVNHLIYPTPNPQFPFLGVHYTRMIHGGIEAGPNAVMAFAREGYKLTDIEPADLFDALTFPGLWKFIAKYPSVAVHELARSISKPLFVKTLQRLVPEIRDEDLVPGGAGVRSQAMSPEGELVHDFDLLERPNALHVLNAPSPAATASLAIGGEIASRIVPHL